MKAGASADRRLGWSRGWPALGAWAPEAALFALLAAALAWISLVAPINHDEDLYLAATQLAGRLTLYRDFLYLQTPLLPQATAWLPPLVPGHAFVALRLSSVLFGVVALWAVWAAQRQLGVGRAPAATATLLLAACYPFQYCSAVYRNDALPTALLSLALLAMAGRKDTGPTRRAWAAAGLLLGLAASAKVTFALPLAAAGGWLLWRAARSERAERRRSLEDVVVFSVGAAVGLAPSALAFAAAPEGFLFGVAGFWGKGVTGWYLANGLGFRISPLGRALNFLINLSYGPALPALVIVGWRWLRALRGGRPRPRAEVLLEVLLLAGLVAAALPIPSYKQYLVVLLPPLFVRLGVGGFGKVEGRRPSRAVLLLAAGSVVGLVASGVWLSPALKADAPVAVRVERENRWIGDRMRAAGLSGEIATLSAHRVVDSGYTLDPRFSTATVAYREANAWPAARLRAFHVSSPRTLAADLDASRPAAIVTGYEAEQSDFRIRLEPAFRAYALSRGYRLQRSPFGRAELFLRQPSPTPSGLRR